MAEAQAGRQGTTSLGSDCNRASLAPCARSPPWSKTGATAHLRLQICVHYSNRPRAVSSDHRNILIYFPKPKARATQNPLLETDLSQTKSLSDADGCAMPLVDSVFRGFLRMGKSAKGTKYTSRSKGKRKMLTHRYSKKGYYKGTGARIVGRLTSKAQFIPDPEKHLELIVPELEGFVLKPYVVASVGKTPPEQ
eukprot:scaffold3226_cov251-Pinguiococcus_pyrenoidosus.AAC.11